MKRLLFTIYLALIAVGACGYFANIVKLVSDFDVIGTGEMLLRGAGIVLPPLGSIMGLFV